MDEFWILISQTAVCRASAIFPGLKWNCLTARVSLQPERGKLRWSGWPPAVGSAISAATGMRLRALPLVPDSLAQNSPELKGS